MWGGKKRLYSAKKCILYTTGGFFLRGGGEKQLTRSRVSNFPPLIKVVISAEGLGLTALSATGNFGVLSSQFWG